MSKLLQSALIVPPPQYIESLVRIAASRTDKPIVVYPNKGETYDAVTKCWLPLGHGIEPFMVYAQRWYAAGGAVDWGLLSDATAGY